MWLYVYIYIVYFIVFYCICIYRDLLKLLLSLHVPWILKWIALSIYPANLEATRAGKAIRWGDECLRKESAGQPVCNVCVYSIYSWLVVWNMNFIFPFSWECHNPNWRTHIFRRVGQPPTRSLNLWNNLHIDQSSSPFLIHMVLLFYFLQGYTCHGQTWA